jgi:hypothetical protein
VNPFFDSPIAPFEPPPKPGWNLYIFSPEESEKMLREEPRLSAWQVLADLEREYLGDSVDG